MSHMEIFLVRLLEGFAYHGISLFFFGFLSCFMESLKAGPARLSAFPCLNIESVNTGRGEERAVQGEAWPATEVTMIKSDTSHSVR